MVNKAESLLKEIKELIKGLDKKTDTLSDLIGYTEQPYDVKRLKKILKCLEKADDELSK